MDKNLFDVILDMSDPDFADKLAKEIGVSKGDTIQIVMPQFERTDKIKIAYFPKTMEEYEFLKTFSEDSLKKLGLGIWDKTDKGTHWLYPHEWYDYIPNGLTVTNIFGEDEIFEKGKTDDDKRYGMLSFGFISD